MAKQTKETFVEKVVNKHGDKYDFTDSVYKGLDKEITYKCPIHGEVTQIAKKVLVHSGCPLCDQEKAKKNRRGGKSAKNKGSQYELQIAKELSDCGYPNVVTSRSESKRKDDMKIDLIDQDGKLPFYAQCKKTRNTPNYFGIEDECPLKDKPFVIFWNKQEVKEGNVNMSSAGEIVMIPKEYFYKLLQK